MRRRQPEAAIQRALVLHLQARAWPDVVWWHHPAGGYRGPAEVRVMVGLGTMAGIPSLRAVRCGNLFCLELKSPGGRLTEAQAAMIARFDRAGAFTGVCHGLDAAIRALEAWNLLRGCIE